MAVYYFDASALAKAYLVETGTAWVRSILDPAGGNDIHILNLTEVEVASAIARRSRAGAISPSLAAATSAQLQNDVAAELHVMDISATVVQRAISLVGQYALRAYDAVQLAAALELQAERTALGLPPAMLVSADLELNAAATAEGLTVENPNTHP